MKTNTAQRFERYIKEALMIDGTSQFQVTKVARVTLIGNIAQTWIVGTAIDGLTLYRRFESRNARRYLATIDGNGLCDTCLFLLNGNNNINGMNNSEETQGTNRCCSTYQLVRIDDAKLKLFHASKPHSRVSKVLRGHPEGGSTCLVRSHGVIA